MCPPETQDNFALFSNFLIVLYFKFDTEDKPFEMQPLVFRHTFFKQYVCLNLAFLLSSKCLIFTLAAETQAPPPPQTTCHPEFPLTRLTFEPYTCVQQSTKDPKRIRSRFLIILTKFICSSSCSILDHPLLLSSHLSSPHLISHLSSPHLISHLLSLLTFPSINAQAPPPPPPPPPLSSPHRRCLRQENCVR